jgi:hypothetical protein
MAGCAVGPTFGVSAYHRGKQMDFLDTQEVFIPLGIFHEWSFLKYVKTFNSLYKLNYQEY